MLFRIVITLPRDCFDEAYLCLLASSSMLLASSLTQSGPELCLVLEWSCLDSLEVLTVLFASWASRLALLPLSQQIPMTADVVTNLSWCLEYIHG